jgi:hypothetical protein
MASTTIVLIVMADYGPGEIAINPRSAAELDFRLAGIPSHYAQSCQAVKLFGSVLI